MVLGCIADDYTGATDVACALRRAGYRPAIFFGGPPAGTEGLGDADAVVIALKIRTVPAERAVAQAAEAAEWFAGHGVRRVYYKYCSTFDSTDEGNIGPVTDALVDGAGADVTIVCPASPEHGRTVYGGHLFVHDVLLSESSMRHHPLTPMTDANLVRVLGRQTPHRVGLVPHAVVRSGPDAVRARIEALAADGVRHVVTDAIDDGDLAVLVAATASLPVLTGAAGLASALGAGGTAPTATARALPTGPAVVLAGSCSQTTLEQVVHARERMPSYRLDPLATPDPADMRDRALAWLADHQGRGPVLVYSSASPEERRAAAHVLGARAPEVFEEILGALALQARDDGARRLVIAGGETSGTVIASLGVGSVLVAGEEDAGVPWCLTTDAPETALLLKSGNFGGRDLLVRATTSMGGTA
ncbi:four-carbon acid sugar kinase family protein [Georgenia yuyongxinii]|uniref:3-oxo-tetronate kinase n=1 Tax=Georgenia yuyongxinii TaxID=2589797 RepID=A0A552WP45_9MICO|nr:four-carbon acid sugar kinase family protein [Georgenia yuyongxinii]